MLHPAGELVGDVAAGKPRLDCPERAPVSRSGRGLRQTDGTLVKSGLSE